MPAQRSPAKQPSTGPAIPTTDQVLHAARSIRTIRSRGLAVTLKTLPWLALIVALVVLFPGNPIGAHGPELFGTAVLVVVVVLFAFQILLKRVPETLEVLWRRKLIRVRSDRLEKKQKLDDGKQAELYLAYLHEFEALLNSRRWQIAMIIVFELLVNLWLGFLNADFLVNLVAGRIELLRILELLIDMIVAAMLAPMAWRLIVIGLQIWRLPAKFDLKIQFEHPDQCGGLEPVGSLCLLNILIVSLPLIFLGGWLLIARSDTSSFSFYNTAWWGSVLAQANAYADVYATLLWALVPFTFLGFILPLWSTHRVMADKQKKMLAQLDEHVENITDEWNTILDKFGDLTVKDGNEILERLEFAKQVYQRQKRVPVWPVNLNIFLKFASTQVFPLLSLTGLGPGMIKILSLIITFVGSS